MPYKKTCSNSSSGYVCPMLNFGHVLNSQGIPHSQTTNQPGNMLVKKMQYSAMLRRPSNKQMLVFGASSYSCNGQQITIQQNNAPTVIRSVPLNDFHRH